MIAEQMRDLAVAALEDVKGRDLAVLDVRGMTSITDYMIIASATSSRHLKALADSVLDKAQQHQLRPLGCEGENGGEWALIDLGDVIVHVMTPEIRDFYQLEKLWGEDAPALGAGQG
ncbi:MAG: ribosome silencing factor [Gammaproteobacteria bacterium]|nr:ribosome silencing factor [Gammaproteobacteria bacterium]